jgi:membrane protein YfhO
MASSRSSTAATAARSSPARAAAHAVATTLASEPRRATMWAAVVCALVTLVLAYPALTGGFLVNPHSDQYVGGYAVREFGTRLWMMTGHVPQWNPYLFGGMPYIAAQANGDVFYPTFLLRVFLPADVAVTWAFIIHEFLAGWLAYLFLRAMGLSFWGALIAGVAYMLGGPISSYVSPGHDGKLYVSALFPLMALFALYGVRDGKRWAFPALLLTVGLGILTPHPQLMQYCLLGVGAVAVYGAFWAGEPLPRQVAIRRLGLALAAVGIGLLIGAIEFGPALAYVKFSPRAAGGLPGYSPYEFSTSYSMPPEELFNSYLPEFTGLLDNYFGRTGVHYQSDYIGAAVWALAGAALAGLRGATPVRRRTVWFWVSVAVVGVLWTFGGYTPFFHIVYALVPGTKYFRAPAAFFFLPAFAVAALAGEGIDAILARRVPRWYPIAAVAVAAFIVALAASGGLTAIGASIARPELYDLVVANATRVTLGAVRALVAVALVSGVIMAVARQRLDAGVAVSIVLAVVVLELWSVGRLYWKFMPPASRTYASDAAIDYLRTAPPGRVLSAPLGEGGKVEPHDAEYMGNALMIHGIRQVMGYHGNEIRRYDELLDHDNGNRDVANPQIWRLLNFRYLLTNVDSVPLNGVRRVVGPVTNAAGSTVYLYRLPGDNPPAWVTPVAVKAPDDQTLATVRDPRFDPTRAAIFDTAARVSAARDVRTLPPALPETVSVTRYDPGHMTYQLSGPAPACAALVASENYYPGWTATVDGKPAPVGRADYTLIGVPLPAGARTVDLVYHDPAFPTGVKITLLGILIGLGWLIVAWALDRRSRGATAT